MLLCCVELHSHVLCYDVLLGCVVSCCGALHFVGFCSVALRFVALRAVCRFFVVWSRVVLPCVVLYLVLE